MVTKNSPTYTEEKRHRKQKILYNYIIYIYNIYIYIYIYILYIYMGQCPAKSGLWGYNVITIKIACCNKQHIFATVLRFPFKFRTLVPTPFL